MFDFGDFHFLRPLWLLALIPLGLLLFGLLHQTRGVAIWERICDPNLLRHLLVDGGGGNTRRPMVLLGVVWLAATVALAGPVWSRLPQPVFKTQGARVIVLDLSRTMDATDLRPSRLALARYKLRDILKRSDEGQTALIVFAGDAYVISPLTDDADTIASMVPALTTDLMPGKGKRLDLALRQAGKLLKGAGVGRGDILLITDGVVTPGAALEVLRDLGGKYRVSILAVGTEEGAPIPVEKGGFLQDGKGGIVISGLDGERLREIARIGGGGYAELSVDESDLERVLLPVEPERKQAATVPEEKQTVDTWREEGPWLVLLLLPLAAVGFRRGWVLLLVALVVAEPPAVYAFGWGDLWSRQDQQGAKAFAAGEHELAAGKFNDPNWSGSAHYRNGDYAQAAEAFSRMDTPDAHYNRGNALAKTGQLQEALEAYQAALDRESVHTDAAHNQQLIKKLLEQQQQQQQNSQQPGEGEESPQSGEDQDKEGQQGQDGKEDDQPQSESGQEGQPQGQDQSDGENEPRQGEKAEDGQDPEEATSSTGNSESEEGEEENRESPPEAPAEDERQAQTATQGGEPEEEGKEQGSAGSSNLEAEEEQSESKQAMEQWLRRIPDDPGGLLRRKIMLEHLRR
ncbi:MAG: VWA domain-containing protein, partial [Gammaproteobacteria bacterium]|nr:VWA domain-containing protein [Gammaproteobacteria bacterium]